MSFDYRDIVAYDYDKMRNNIEKICDRIGDTFCEKKAMIRAINLLEKGFITFDETRKLLSQYTTEADARAIGEIEKDMDIFTEISPNLISASAGKGEYDDLFGLRADIDIVTAKGCLAACIRSTVLFESKIPPEVLLKSFHSDDSPKYSFFVEIKNNISSMNVRMETSEGTYQGSFALSPSETIYFSKMIIEQLPQAGNSELSINNIGKEYLRRIGEEKCANIGGGAYTIQSDTSKYKNGMSLIIESSGSVIDKTTIDLDNLSSFLPKGFPSLEYLSSLRIIQENSKSKPAKSIDNKEL